MFWRSSLFTIILILYKYIDNNSCNIEIMLSPELLKKYEKNIFYL